MKGAWVIAGAVLLSTALLIGFFIYQARGDEKCDKWQDAVKSAAGAIDDWSVERAGLIFSKSKPEGCPYP